MIYIIRRNGLGKDTLDEVVKYSNNDIKIIRSDKVLPTNVDLLIRWGCIKTLESERVLNTVEAIKLVNNKYIARKIMLENNINTPKLYDINDYVEYPVIVRPHKHQSGKDFFICDSLDSLKKAVLQLPNCYISQYIPKRQEFGVFIFNNRVFAVIEKVPAIHGANERIIWNYDSGSHTFDNVEWSNWPIDVCREALKAAFTFGIDFCRVDVIVEDKPYVLELNSAFGLTSEYRQQTFAKCIDYYVEKGSVQNPICYDGSWKTIIHPALRINKQNINI